MARPHKGPATDEGERFLARVAWAYHVEGLTQGAVAERLGVTRVRVNKALAEARRSGLVRISFSSALASCVEAEAELRARYGLKEAFVAPWSDDDEGEPRAIVGAALGHHLSQLLAYPAIRRFGVGWGHTINVALRHFEPVDRPDVEIVSVMGGTTRGGDVSSFEITARMADLCNASHTFFPAPLYAGSKVSRDLIIGQDVFTEILEKIRQVDALAMTVGDISDRSLLIRDALPADIEAASLRETGAVGDCLGTVLDADGTPVAHRLNERLIGIGFEDLKAIPDVILASGGLHKVPVMRAVLKRGVVDTLVTDEGTARALLGGGVGE
jgi:DNA-binding transcriptional regulator LsrR (DeoR family)